MKKRLTPLGRKHEMKTTKPKILLLTLQELRVLTLHQPDKITAAALGISTRCVRFHWRNILKKFGVLTRLDAAVLHGKAVGRLS